MLHASDIGLIRVGENWKFLRGLQAPPADWIQPEFEDRSWSESVAGFSTAGGYGEATFLHDYGTLYQSIYFRKRFTVASTNGIQDLLLRLDYNDGVIIYLNGREVARRGVPGEPGSSAPTNVVASVHARGMTEEIYLTDHIDALHAGENVMAVHLAGSGAGDSAFAFVPELLANFARVPYVQNTTTRSTRIVWRSIAPVTGLIEHGTNTTEVRRIEFEGTRTNHVAALENLEPDMRYFYRVGSRSERGETWSDWSSFKTFKLSGEITFAVIGDSGWASPQQYMVAEQMARTEVDLILHTGDLCYPAINERNADHRLLSVYAPQMRTTPMFWVPGNHDNGYNLQIPLEIFHQPTNDVYGTELFYSFDHGDAHFAVVWSDLLPGSRYHPGSPQYEWLERDLAATEKPWKFVLLHHCWRTSAIHIVDDYDFNGIRDHIQLDAVAELASRYGVQAVINGHDHCFERFTPSRGVVSYTSGGGGAGLYPFYAKHPDTVQFHSKFNFMKVSVAGEVMTVHAIDELGRLFDASHIARRSPAKTPRSAAWHRPVIETVPSDDFDGNIRGQTFDFAGEPIYGFRGGSSSAGRLFVNNDAENLYLGMDNLLLHDGDEVYLFVAASGLAGATNLANFGWPVAFTNFSPGAVIVLGDEYLDLPGPPPAAGLRQGAMLLREGLPMIPDQRVQQFNRSPQSGEAIHERASNFAEVAVPLEELGLPPGATIKVAVVTRLASESRPFDSGGIMTADREPMEVRLAVAPSLDSDGDGAPDSAELLAGTDAAAADSVLRISTQTLANGGIEVSWQAIPGKWYSLERFVGASFRDALHPSFPRQARTTQERQTIAPGGEYEFYRVTVMRE